MLTKVNLKVSVFRDGVLAHRKHLLYHFSLTCHKKYNFQNVVWLFPKKSNIPFM